MSTDKLKERFWKAEYQLRVIIQSLDEDSVYFKYLLELQQRLLNKGFLYPSEYKKLNNWKTL